MRQALIGVRHGVLLRCALIRPPEEHSTPGSLKALHVSLVKPVAYLKDRVIAYARPFTRNKPLGPFSVQWSTFSNTPFQETHDELIRARHQFIAHSDEETRRVDIFPPGARVGETGLTSGGVSISIRTIAFPTSRFHHIRDLCYDLG